MPKNTIAKAIVIIPFYRNEISAYEIAALQQCFKILSGHPIVAIKPDSLVLSRQLQGFPFANIVSFDDHYFRSIRGYNELKMSADFYRAFLPYEFMLIHQLDAFVFQDSLIDWCDRGYDYIGAPWLREIDHPDIFKAVKSKSRYYLHRRYNIQENGEPTKYQYENRVGNGGFSLRRVEKFYELCLEWQTEITAYLQNSGHHFNEDRFWSVEINRKRNLLQIPGYKTGVKFSIEFAPQRALKLTKGKLPFGCHAWDKKIDFWGPIIKNEGYDI